MKASTLIVCVVLVAAVGLGWWRYQARFARALDNSSTIVRISNAGVEVSSPPGRSVESVDPEKLVAHLREVLRLAAGSTVGIVISGEGAAADSQFIQSRLIEAGFRISGVMKVGFITTPEENR